MVCDLKLNIHEIIAFARGVLNARGREDRKTVSLLLIPYSLFLLLGNKANAEMNCLMAKKKAAPL